jgi:hypothetical protein
VQRRRGYVGAFDVLSGAATQPDSGFSFQAEFRRFNDNGGEFLVGVIDGKIAAMGAIRRVAAL